MIITQCAHNKCDFLMIEFSSENYKNLFSLLKNEIYKLKKKIVSQ